MTDSPKTLFLTGASTGLGRATALLFASRGWKVIATMRTPERETELGQVPGIHLLPLDVTNPAQVEATAKAALALGPVDVVLANAGYALGGPLEAMSEAQLTREIDTNLLGVMRTVKAFLPHLRERRSGTVLVTSSATGHVGMPLLSAYSATKFALEGFVQSLAFELAPFDVRVKSIVPGAMRTDFLHRSLDRAEHPAYADFVAKVMRVFIASAEGAVDGTPEHVAESVWTAATDGREQLDYVATAEASQVVAARAQLGADGMHAMLRQRLDG